MTLNAVPFSVSQLQKLQRKEGEETPSYESINKTNLQIQNTYRIINSTSVQSSDSADIVENPIMTANDSYPMKSEVVVTDCQRKTGEAITYLSLYYATDYNEDMPISVGPYEELLTEKYIYDELPAKKGDYDELPATPPQQDKLRQKVIYVNIMNIL